MVKGTGLLALICLLLALGCATAFERGNQAYMRGDWDQAAVQYERALAEAENPMQAEQIRTQLGDSRQKASTQHLDVARKYLAIGDNRQAALHLEQAFLFNATPEVQALLAQLRPAEGARFLQEGKTAFEAQRWPEAVALLSKAQEWAPSEEGNRLLVSAREQVRLLEPANYRITIHSATILPFKPAQESHWDGLGGREPTAKSILRGLGEVASDPTGISALVMGANLMSAATNKPDCYLQLTVSGQPHTVPRQNTQPDTLQPVWDVSFVVYGANSRDSRIVHILVVDQDLTDITRDDTVGSRQFTIGQLVERPVREFSFVSSDGSTPSDGILVLKVSAEKLGLNPTAYQ